MLIFLEIVVFGLGIKMIFTKYDVKWDLGNWVGVMLVTGAVLFELIFYWLTHQNPY
jgi:hypothetical protein